MICGLKLTHDGALAVVDEGRLLFCVEAEKIANNKRYSTMDDASTMLSQLHLNGLSTADIHAVSIDGWLRWKSNRDYGIDVTDVAAQKHRIRVAPYIEFDDPDNSGPFANVQGTLPLDGSDVPYRSFPHAVTHVFASYCTSPFAAANEPALILVWDGYMPASLYSFDPRRQALTAYGPALDIAGVLYPIFASFTSQFRSRSNNGDGTRARPGGSRAQDLMLSLSGKVMAYAGLGEPDERAIAIFERITEPMLPLRVARTIRWTRMALEQLAPLEMSDASILASFQEFLGRALRRGLAAKVAEHPELANMPLCLTGGCALNIKWNSALRSSGLFTDIWVPPFPNDSGSAIGAACVEMIRTTGRAALEWSVFSGPEIIVDDTPVPGWSRTKADLDQVAQILHGEGEPVVMLYGHAELWPRALGHRSIIAPATDLAMRDRLNEAKGREWYRPVAPICLESRAPEVFDPGVPDPFMLFDHAVRPEWRDRVPAVVHADGTARLETVGNENGFTQRLLQAYERLSGVPVLCNTSANFSGSGFFPDAASAMEWGKTKYVWCDGTLFTSERVLDRAR